MVGQRDIRRAVPPRRAFWKSNKGASALDLDPHLLPYAWMNFLFSLSFTFFICHMSLTAEGRCYKDERKWLGGNEGAWHVADEQCDVVY